jgi:uncharacterized protein YndB with AHSA1/START domain
MAPDLIATASVDIDALADDVWFAMTDPAAIARWMDGSRVVTDWRPGSPITWSGEHDGRRFEDHGEVLEAAPGTLLKFRQVTPGRDGAPDRAHVVSVRLAGIDENRTRVTLAQDGVADEAGRRQSERHWEAMLGRLKVLVEQKRPSPL